MPRSPLGGGSGGGFTSPVTPGTGWPGDLATPATPVAHTPDDVRRLAGAATSVCRTRRRGLRMPGLSAPGAVARGRRGRQAAVLRRASPTGAARSPGGATRRPAVLVVGLAPAAHGGNRTGRIFTGDRSGDWLFAALHRAGLATLPTSEHAGDGQRLLRTRMVAAVRCAPPANAPTPEERDTCAPWLDRELALVAGSLRVVVALGGFAWQALLAALGRAGHDGAATAAEVRPRRRGRGRRPAGDRVVPPEPAEHLHRPADRAHVRPGLRSGGGTRRPAASLRSDAWPPNAPAS